MTHTFHFSFRKVIYPAALAFVCNRAFIVPPALAAEASIPELQAAAEGWYAAAAKLHDPVAEFNLASLFSVVKDHPRDLPKAAALLRRSASSGYVPAMHSLGLLLVNRPELAVSGDEAQPLLEAASNAGSWRSTIALGILKRDGAGAPGDPEAAYYLFRIALLQGGEQAKAILANDLKVLSARVSAEHAAALSEQANEWFAKHPLALAFVYKESEASNRYPAYARTVADDAVHAGRLVPVPPA